MWKYFVFLCTGLKVWWYILCWTALHFIFRWVWLFRPFSFSLSLYFSLFEAKRDRELIGLKESNEFRKASPTPKIAWTKHFFGVNNSFFSHVPWLSSYAFVATEIYTFSKHAPSIEHIFRNMSSVYRLRAFKSSHKSCFNNCNRVIETFFSPTLTLFFSSAAFSIGLFSSHIPLHRNGNVLLPAILNMLFLLGWNGRVV